MNQVLKHRCSSILTALLATSSLFLNIGAITTCSFVYAFSQSSASINESNAGSISSDPFEIGLFCATNNSTDRDSSLTIARIFVLIALFISATISILLWSIALFLKVSNCQWKVISITSAVAAFLNIPGYLIFDGTTCKQYNCQLDSGAISLISSIACMALVTVITQLFEAPTWIQNREAWKVNQRRFEFHNCDSDSIGSDDYIRFMSSFYPRKRKLLKPVSFFLSVFHSGNPRHIAMTDDSVEDENDAFLHPDPLINHDLKEVQSYENMLRNSASFYASCDNSRLLLHVTPNGRQIGDEDRRSEWSFASNLEEDIRLAEMERGLQNIEDKQLTMSSSFASHPRIPLQFNPSNDMPSPIVHASDYDYHIGVTSNCLEEENPEQSLLDPEVLIKGAGRLDIFSPFHGSSKTVGKFISSSLANTLLRPKTDPSKYMEDSEDAKYSYPQNVSISGCNERNTDRLSLSSNMIATIPINPSSSEPIPMWETFDNVNEFEKAIDAGTTAANITNETEEDCTSSLFILEDNDYDSIESTHSLNDTREINDEKMAEIQQIIIGVQQLNRGNKKDSAQKKRKKRKKRSSSVSSRYSLLDLTIDEETKDDLELEDFSSDQKSVTLSLHSGIRLKTSSSVSVYLPLHDPSPTHDDPLTAGLRLVSSVLSKMKESSSDVGSNVGSNVGKTMEVSRFIYPTENTVTSRNDGSDEGSL